MKNVGVTILVLLTLCGSATAIEVLEPGYIVETYVTYSESGVEKPCAMTFDDSGNLYVVQREAWNTVGSIWRTTTEKEVSQFASGFDRPRGIEWAGGTSYGDYLYVIINRAMVKVALDGTTSNFADIQYQPTAVAVDRIGNYGGYLYAATGGQDHIYRVDTDGSVTMFSNWPGWTDGGCPYGIDFDSGTNYGGLMYVATSFTQGNAHKSGLFTLNTSGTATRFTDDLVAALHIEFDRAGDFGGELFVTGKSGFDESWEIWRVGPDGTATEFARTTISDPYGLAFGPDGAMYIAEYSSVDETVIISRIIPEPTTVLLLGLGGIMLRRRR